MTDLILIIDFMNYVHRCRVGNLEGEHVLTFNFFRNLRATVEQMQPTKLFFALEGYPKHRYELFSDYKANRIIKTAAKQTSKNQVITAANDIQKLLLLLPITLVQHPNFEADDIINTLALNMKDESVVICSADTDCIQILQNGYKDCQLYNPIKKEFIEPPDYFYVAYKTLVGDKSDHIPRIVSDKKALMYCNDPILFQEFMNVEENRAKVSMNKALIQFANVPLEEMILQEGKRDFVLLKQEFERMDFQSIVNDNSWEKYTKTFDCIKY